MAKKQRGEPAPPAEHTQTPPEPTNETPAPAQPEQQRCPVAGFGASAGGLEAFSEVLQHLGPKPNLACVLVQHLDPKHSSLLTELLARTTKMPVGQVTEGTQVEPNHVYVIPPNTNLAMSGGVLHLAPRPEYGQHMPVDYFFRSLAADQGNRAIGVILSGTASDGTLGLKAIKAEGGITLAQAPESARFDGMPRSAIAAGCVDFVLPPEGLAREIVRMCQHPYLAGAQPGAAAEAPEEGSPNFNEIFGMLRAATAVDFSFYKPGTIRRRIQRRMALHKLENPAQYVTYMRSHRGEVDALFQDILINVTAFFREPATFEALRAVVYPALFRNRASDDTVRVWVPGCSTGEEAYSVAISLIEYMQENNCTQAVQIFGTDLSDAALEKARAGAYPENVAAELSQARLRRFFSKINGGYLISRAVRDLCIFAKQNVTKDPPFSRLDLITCRNVLIYLGPVLQAKVMKLFHYALKPNGFLILGTSESVGGAAELFSAVDKTHKIYSRKPVPSPATLDFDGYEEATQKSGAPQPSAMDLAHEFQRRTDQIILSRYAPASVLVNRDLRVLQFRGPTSQYLEHPSGEADLHLLKMSRGSLGLQVRELVQKADRGMMPAQSEAISIPGEQGMRQVRVSVMPVEVPGTPERQFLVVFEEADATPAVEKKPGERPVRRKAGDAERVSELEQELAATRQYLQSVIEEQEAATEELKSANEEIQSSNEELQSTNEELLTAKEELQSTNEELTTVNEEMQGRNDELVQTNNDLLNLLSSVNIPIVMLGGDLRIRRFTPQAEKILNLLPTDMGRPISDFKLKINVPDLERLVTEVLDTLQTREREVHDLEGRIYSMWVRPYRTADNKIDGAVLALFDLTGRREAAEARYRRLFESARDGILVADAETGEILDANPFACRVFGYQRAELVGTRYWEAPVFRNTPLDRNVLREMEERETVQLAFNLNNANGQLLNLEVLGNAYLEGSRRVVQFNVRDVTGRRQAEERIRRSQEDAEQAQKLEAVGRLAGSLAHEFSNHLTAILGYCEMARRQAGPRSELRASFDEIQGAAERAAAITRQLLVFGRQPSGQPELVDLNRLLTDMHPLLGLMVNQHISLRMRPGSELKGVRVDRAEMEQVVLSLLMGARDGMPEGGEITIETANAEVNAAFAAQHPAVPAGRYVALTVAAAGSGSAPHAAALRLEPILTPVMKPVSTGAGMSSIFEIVKTAGGHVWAYSELGVGSTFRVFLPPADGVAEEPSALAAGRELPVGSETVLLVEDDDSVRHLATDVLERCGYQVIAAASGPDALQATESQDAIDLLIVDVVLPQMSGRETADRLLARHPGLKVLYMTGHSDHAVMPHGVLEPGVELLKKPFSAELLASKVREVLEKSRK